MRTGSGAIVTRLLLGSEMLSFQGWAYADYADEGDAQGSSVGQSVLASLAGNAFSAFASGAVLASTLPFLNQAAASKAGSAGVVVAQEEEEKASGAGTDDSSHSGASDIGTGAEEVDVADDWITADLLT